VREHGVESLTILRDLRIQWAIGFALNTRARAAYIDGDLGQAYALIDESVALFRDLKAYSSLAEVLITQGYIVQTQGDATTASRTMAEALRLAWAVGPRPMVAAALEGLASVQVAQGHAQLATHLLAAATTLRVRMGTPVRPADQITVEQTLSAARSTLGDNAFAAVWSDAQALPLEQILSTIPGVAVSAALGD